MVLDQGRVRLNQRVFLSGLTSDGLLLPVWRPTAMARPYSIDVREHVVGWIKAGRSRRVSAARFRVSVASAVR